MKKLTIKDIVKFRRKTEGPRKTFIHNLIIARETGSDADARDYWVRSLSTIKKAFRTNDTQCISDKIDEVKEVLLATTHGNTIKQYNHNIRILKNFEDFDFSIWKPTEEIKILNQYKENKILPIKGLPIEATPSFVFLFNNSGNEEVGAIWFVAQKDGFKALELGMFAEIMYIYLKTHFSKYDINPNFCIVVDLYNGTHIDYLKLEEGAIHKVLNSTLDEIKKLV